MKTRRGVREKVEYLFLPYCTATTGTLGLFTKPQDLMAFVVT